MADKEQSKLRVLEMIRDQREILFGSFSPTLTKVDKINAWDDIAEEAVKLGLMPANKNSSYIRDTFWQNLRKRTLKKLDDHRVTGGPGGKDARLDEIDKIVIDIIGKESNVLKGIDIPESYSVPNNESQVVQIAETASHTDTAEKFEVISIPYDSPELRSKAKLQVELLTLQVRSTKREIYARELLIHEKEKLLTEEEKRMIEEKCFGLNRSL